MPGPARKPDEIKRLAGNPGGRKLNDDAPKLPASRPDKPSFDSDEPGVVWDQLLPRLEAVGLARSIDGNALERYCVLLVSWRRAQAQIKKHGEDYVEIETGPDGKKRIAKAIELPWARRVRDLNLQLIRIEREFGMTPSARSSIRIAQETKAGGDVGALKEQVSKSSIIAAGSQLRITKPA